MKVAHYYKNLLSCTTVSTFDRQHRLKEVGIGETLKSAKREPFWAISKTLQHSPLCVRSNKAAIWCSWEPKWVP